MLRTPMRSSHPLPQLLRNDYGTTTINKMQNNINQRKLEKFSHTYLKKDSKVYSLRGWKRAQQLLDSSRTSQRCTNPTMASFLSGCTGARESQGYPRAQQNHPETTEHPSPVTDSQSLGTVFWHVIVKSSPVDLMTLTHYQSIKHHL